MTKKKIPIFAKVTANILVTFLLMVPLISANVPINNMNNNQKNLLAPHSLITEHLSSTEYKNSYQMTNQRDLKNRSIIRETEEMILLTLGDFIYVDDDALPGGDGSSEHPFQHIQEGIDAANQEDTVFVFNGYYYEKINISKPLKLVGENKNFVVIDGDNSPDFVVFINSDRVTFINFTVRSGSPYISKGILIRGVNNTIKGNIIRKNKQGIYVDFGRNNFISNNILFDNNVGIYILSDNNSISRNIIKKNSKGLDLYNTNNNVITKNIIKCNERGICIRATSEDNVVSKNNLTENIIGGVEISASDYNLISNNNITNNCEGIRIWQYSEHNLILKNIIYNNDFNDISLLDSHNNLIYHNSLSNKTNVSDGGKNFWNKDYPFGGNYWDDFDEPSEGAYDAYHGENQDIEGPDGIVDLGPPNGGLNPYQIPGGNNKDNYSLVEPWDIINEPPYSPFDPNPFNGSCVVNVDSPGLSWRVIDPDGDHLKYDVYFGMTFPPPKVKTNQTDQQFHPGILEFNTTYYWQIIVWDEYGLKSTGPIWQFTTRTNQMPYIPGNPEPCHGDSNVVVDAYLFWSGGDPDGDAVTYDVFFGETSLLPKVQENQTGRIYNPGILEFNTTYYWQIITWDSPITFSVGPLWNFTTVDPPVVAYVNDDYNETTQGWNIDHFSSIQYAINSVRKNGTINVKNGTYNENIVINKRINLIGEDKNTTIIDGTQNADTYDFSFVWMTDTQYYCDSYPEIYDAMTQWIVDNNHEQKIEYVIHTGDIVDGNTETEWEHASHSMSILENETNTVPYGVLAGNHDLGGFNDFFGLWRFKNRMYYGGNYAPSYGYGDNKNHYDLLSINGMEFIILYLSYNIMPQELAWANQILKTYSDKKAILAFHTYLKSNGEYSEEIWNEGQEIFNALVAPNDNVFMVLCGHNCGAVCNTIQIGDRVVYEILANYQCEPYGGNGYMRLLQFNVSSDTIHMKTYSPWLDDYNYYADWKDEFDLEFSLDTQTVFIHAPWVNINEFTIRNGAKSGIATCANHTKIQNNLIIDNAYGITADGRNKTITGMFIRNNDIRNNTDSGIILKHAILNVVYNNTLMSNGNYGIILQSSSNNILLHNAFMENLHNSIDDSTNLWDNSYFVGGNYWDDFDEPSEGAYDAYHGENQDIEGSDGIVDLGPPNGGLNPYQIPGGNNKDNYPLITLGGGTSGFPYIPWNPAPENGSIIAILNPTLSWLGGDPDGDTVTYDIYFGETSSPPKVQENQTEQTYDPGVLEFNTTYYWQIIAWDEYGLKSTGPIWQFTTRTNQMPYIPGNPEPNHGDFDVIIAPNLFWSGGDPDWDTVTYDIYFGETSSPPKVQENQTEQTYDPGVLEFNTTYYWQIIVWDEYGLKSTGPIWQFTTRTNHPPNVPNNPHPYDGKKIFNFTDGITLSWSGGDPDGDKVVYDVYFGDTEIPNKIVTQSETSYGPIIVEKNITYYWKIIAKDTCNTISIGPLWNFNTVDPPLIVHVDDDYNESTSGWEFDHYNQIQYAINAVADNGSVFVRTGIYTEQIYIDKALQMMGEDKVITIIDGEQESDVVTIDAQNISIIGFTIQNTSYSGITVQPGSNHAIINNNIISGNNKGIEIATNNKGIIISENYITNNNDGINGELLNSLIINNIVNYNENSGIVIDIMSMNNTIINNTVTNNGNEGIDLYSSLNTVTDNTIVGNHYNGILIHDASSNSISGNVLFNNQRYGISAEDDTANNTIYYNIFVDNEYGNAEDKGENIWNDDYPAGGNFWGDYTGEDNYNGLNQDIPGSDGIGDMPYFIPEGDNQDKYPLLNLQDPFILNINTSEVFSSISQAVNDDNTLNGHVLDVLPSDYLEEIIVTKSITLRGLVPTYTHLYGNQQSDSITFLVDGVTLTGFTIQQSSPEHCALHILSNNNSIYHNNFINNAVDVVDAGSNTSWDAGYPHGGNYWDDYVGDDEYYGTEQDIPGSDGIGDTPYDIPNSNQKDRYPFMHLWNGTSPVQLPIPDVVYVDDEYDASTPDWGYLRFNTIQEAIDMVAEHGKVIVYSGEYSAEGSADYFLLVNKPVQIVGENKETTIINGSTVDLAILVEMYTSDVTISGFTVKSSLGLYALFSENITVCDTIFKTTYSGITAELLSNSTLSGNVFSNNSIGISLGVYSCHNIVFENTFANCSEQGLLAYYESDDNLFFHNNFINNTQNAYDECSNIWYNESLQQGNYWDDYIGEDNFHGPNQDIPGSDGIGDIPYDIPSGDNQDKFPLMIYPRIPGDINGDNVINTADLLILLGEWGNTDSYADVNGDGIVNTEDLLILLGNWG